MATKKNEVKTEEKTVFERIAEAFQAFVGESTETPEDEIEALKQERAALEKFYAVRKDEINADLKRIEERENMKKIAEALKNERDGLVEGGISEEEADYIMNSRLEKMLLNEQKDNTTKISYIPISTFDRYNPFSITTTATSIN